MEKDLKTQNTPWLAGIYVGAFLLMALSRWGAEDVFEYSERLAQQAIVVAVITSFGAALSNLLPNVVKHPVVYFRIKNVLSAHRCKRICLKDARLDLSKLQEKWPKLFCENMEEKDQNAYWYTEIYRTVRNAPEVLQSHRSFLLFRDAASGLLILLIGLLVWSRIAEWVSLPSLGMWPMVLLAGVILVLCQAARQSGDRMVANSVAAALSE